MPLLNRYFPIKVEYCLFPMGFLWEGRCRENYRVCHFCVEPANKPVDWALCALFQLKIKWKLIVCKSFILQIHLQYAARVRDDPILGTDLDRGSVVARSIQDRCIKPARIYFSLECSQIERGRARDHYAVLSKVSVSYTCNRRKHSFFNQEISHPFWEDNICFEINHAKILSFVSDQDDAIFAPALLDQSLGVVRDIWSFNRINTLRSCLSSDYAQSCCPRAYIDDYFPRT